jgi:hypothetical protein
MGFISRGFRGRREADAPAGRIPPGQYVTPDFPVLSAGPTPRVRLEEWRLVRCPSCTTVLMVAVRFPAVPRIYFSSLRWLQPAS